MDAITNARPRSGKIQACHRRSLRTLFLTCTLAVFFALGLFITQASARVAITLSETPSGGASALDIPIIRTPVGGGTVFGQNQASYTVTITAIGEAKIQFFTVTLTHANGAPSNIKINPHVSGNKRRSAPISIQTTDTSFDTIVISASDAPPSSSNAPLPIFQKTYVFKAMSLTPGAGTNPVTFTAINAGYINLWDGAQWVEIHNTHADPSNTYTNSLPFAQAGTYCIVATARKSVLPAVNGNCPQNTNVQLCLPVTITANPTAGPGMFLMNVYFRFNNSGTVGAAVDSEGLRVDGSGPISFTVFVPDISGLPHVPAVSLPGTFGSQFLIPLPVGTYTLTGTFTNPPAGAPRKSISCTSTYTATGMNDADFDFLNPQETNCIQG